MEMITDVVMTINNLKALKVELNKVKGISRFVTTQSIIGRSVETADRYSISQFSIPEVEAPIMTKAPM